MNVILPIPVTFEQWVWLGIGLTFGRAFGKRVDQEIQATEWFKTLNPFYRWWVKRLLDFLHHWWMGTLIMLYWQGPLTLPTGEVINFSAYWFGYGVFLDDLPDIPRRIRGLLTVPLFKKENEKEVN